MRTWKWSSLVSLLTEFFFALTFFLSSFFACKDIFLHAHTYTSTDAHTNRTVQSQTDTLRNTHSLVLSQLMKWLVRYPMCRTYGSLPVHWIALNRWTHSSVDMIVLMDGNNIQTAAQTRQLRVDACIFLSWRGRKSACFFLSAFIFTFVPVCLCLCLLGVAQTASLTQQ